MSREAVSSKTRPITSREDLFDVFENGGRPRTQFSIGLESELLGVDSQTGESLPFDGPRGVEKTLRDLHETFGAECVMNGDRVIGLIHDETAVTLEPGGQLELSSRQHQSVEGVKNELYQHLAELKFVSKRLGTSWLALGVQPVTPRSKIAWVPKFRYRIMRNYYEKRADSTFDMMLKTASVQTNFDFVDEADARKKMRLGGLLGPVLGALCANSAIEEGKLNGFVSRRMAIWQDTDLDRTGVPSFFVDGTFSFEKYVDYALDVPMYFILRNGEYLDRTGTTFREYMKTAPDRDPATMSDWINHLTTLFPDVRLKGHLEFRTSDAVAPKLVLAVAAFWKALTFDADATDEALERTKAFGMKEILAANRSVSYEGLQAQMGKQSILEIARSILGVAKVGLSRLDHRDGTFDIQYLTPFLEIAEIGQSPGETARKNWHGDIRRFIQCHQI